MSSSNAFALREATPADLDDITRIHIERRLHRGAVRALYCFPKRNEYPADYWRWSKQWYQDVLDQPEKYLVHNLAVLTKVVTHPGLDERKDVNIAHFEAFGNAAGQRFPHILLTVGEEPSQPLLLGCASWISPTGRGHDAGALGHGPPKGQGWPVTLCASPMGELLYKYLGIKTIATEFVQVEGEEESLESAVMAWES
ncbi:acyl-CoA N-acyltransferase [Podospora australis]|uniref:Acyl-CoA N-acyltransferase n=1 Tax=Podospora australis TaxID=1536484 RepID=A0AAN6WKR5_9PEZI|nr:acyl-CoA N-acyltransferase [Podospora australis]